MSFAQFSLACPELTGTFTYKDKVEERSITINQKNCDYAFEVKGGMGKSLDSIRPDSKAYDRSPTNFNDNDDLSVRQTINPLLVATPQSNAYIRSSIEADNKLVLVRVNNMMGTTKNCGPENQKNTCMLSIQKYSLTKTGDLQEENFASMPDSKPRTLVITYKRIK